MESFSKFFTFEEFTDSKDHPELVAQNRIEAKQYLLAGKRLSKLLESIRHILGDKPLTVSSGFRNEALNKAVGSRQDGKEGRKLSNHCKFEACDIISQMPIKEAFNALINAHRGGLLPDLRKCIIEQIGSRKWLHVEQAMKVGDYIGFLTTSNGVNYTKVA